LPVGSGSATADISESSAGEVKICQMFRARSASFSLQNVLEMEYLYLKALMLGMAFAFGLGGTWPAGYWRVFSDRRRKQNMKSRNRCEVR